MAAAMLRQFRQRRLRPIMVAAASAVAALPFAAGCAMAEVPRFDPRGEIAFVCSVNGAEHVRPAQSAEEICGLFRQRLAERIGHPVRPQASLPTGGDAIALVLTIPGNRSATAAVTTRNQGESHSWPDFTFDVMDTAIGPSHIDSFARDLARILLEPAR